MTPGRKFSSSASARSTSAMNTVAAAGCLRSSAIDCLPALTARNDTPMPACAYAGSAPSRRARSPSGLSTLITRAPRQASWYPANGPASTLVRSRTVMPSSGRTADGAAPGASETDEAAGAAPDLRRSSRPGRGEGTGPATSLANAESPEDDAEQIIRREFAGDRGQRGLRLTQFLGEKFDGWRLDRHLRTAARRCATRPTTLHMAFAGEERIFGVASAPTPRALRVPAGRGRRRRWRISRHAGRRLPASSGVASGWRDCAKSALLCTTTRANVGGRRARMA